MGNMRDAFKKANLLSDKDAKRLAHEERVHRSEVGREGTAAEQRQREAELARLQERERERTRQQQQELERSKQREAERDACLALLETEARKPSPSGRMRFYFELEDGRLPSVEVSEAELRQLQAGGLCIVRLKPGRGHVYGLIATLHARRIAKIFPERVVHAPRGLVAN